MIEKESLLKTSYSMTGQD